MNIDEKGKADMNILKYRESLDIVITHPTPLFDVTLLLT